MNWKMRTKFGIVVIVSVMVSSLNPIVANAQPTKCTTTFTAPTSSSATFSGTPNQTVVASANVRVLLSEGFEVGAFPPGQGNWNVTGSPQWDDETFKPFTGSWSAWAAGGGTGALNPASGNYANNMNSWMVAGPFDLSLSLAPRVSFNWWNVSEANYDRLYWLASTNGTNFYGYASSGNTGGWRFETFDLTTVPTLGNLAGQSRVWIAFRFQSDSSCTYQGAFVDNVTLDQRRWGAFYNPNPVAISGNTSLVDNNNADSSTLTSLRSGSVLKGLDGSGYIRGDYANLADGSGDFSDCNSNKSRGIALNSSLIFDYTRSDDRFEEVNAYFHVDSAQRYIQSLGFTNLLNFPVIIHAHCYGGGPIYGDPISGDRSNARTDFSLRFGDGRVDDAEDAEIILHEYGHLILFAQAPVAIANQPEGAAIHEAFGDYWAASSFAGQNIDANFQACVGEWDATAYSSSNPPCLRRVDTSNQYPQNFDFNPGAPPHTNGLIWSGALWQLWNALGRNKTDKLVLKSHTYYDNDAETRFAEAADALITADFANNSGSSIGTISSVMRQRGIFDVYEYNGSGVYATAIAPNGGPQTHKLHSKTDIDWLKFSATAFSPTWRNAYRVRTFNLGLQVDTEITIIAPNGVAEIVSNDDCPDTGDLSSCVIFAASTTGTYYVRVRPHLADISSTGYYQTYQVEVTTISLPLSVFLPIVMN